ncbi:secretory phospholipase A2 receptor-like isoform 2-T2 [Pholidichthys leucotaenia]
MIDKVETNSQRGFFLFAASYANVYYFIENPMTHENAQDYCDLNYIKFAEILNSANVTKMKDTPTGGYTGKAWIGLHSELSEWTWVNEEPATYTNWTTTLPQFFDHDEFCASIYKSGEWHNGSCTETRPFVCFDGINYIFNNTILTWNEARDSCKLNNSTLALIYNSSMNNMIKTVLPNEGGAWIGLNVSILWILSDTADLITFTNWYPGQPDIQSNLSCGAVEVNDGIWIDEPCDEKYPFFCYGASKSRKTVVKMTIKTSANMELKINKSLLKLQLHRALVRRGITHFTLTWHKMKLRQ